MIHCRACGGQTRVYGGKVIEDEGKECYMRYRVCRECKRLFWTIEKFGGRVEGNRRIGGTKHGLG